MTVSTRSVAGYAVVKTLGKVDASSIVGYAVVPAPEPTKAIQVDDVVGYALTGPSKAAQINDVVGYAMTGPARALAISNVVGYGMTIPSKQIQVNAIVGYGAIIPPKALPKNITGHDALIQLIINTQAVEYEVTDFYLDPPRVDEYNLSLNAIVRCNAGVGSYLYGGMDFRYYRRQLADINDGSPIRLDLTGKTNTLDLLPAINAHTGMILTADDIVASPINVGQKSTILIAKATSWFFQPGSTLKVGDSSVVPLSSAFSTDTIIWS